jgi:acyl-CoA thioester hydrolase
MKTELPNLTEIESFPYRLELRLDWSEQDLFGHINNVNYFKFYQSARLEILKEAGLTELFKQTKVGPTLGNTQCKFIHSLHYPDQIFVHSNIKSIGTTSFVIQHCILNSQKELCAIAEDVIVVFDYVKEVKMAIPEDILVTLRNIN